MSESTADDRDERLRNPDDVSKEDVLGVFEMITGPALTAGDVKLRLGCSSDRARELLEELRSEGEVRRRRSSAAYLYWRTDPDEEVELPDYLTLSDGS